MFDIDKLETTLQKFMKSVADSKNEKLKKDAKDFLKAFNAFLAPFKEFNAIFAEQPEKWDVVLKNE